MHAWHLDFVECSTMSTMTFTKVEKTSLTYSRYPNHAQYIALTFGITIRLIDSNFSTTNNSSTTRVQQKITPRCLSKKTLLPMFVFLFGHII
jgi:hypothetical protein